MTDLEKDKILLLAHSVGKMARELQSIKRLLKEMADASQTEQIKTLDYCDICNHKGCENCIANNLDDYCVPSNYAPKYTPQTESWYKFSSDCDLWQKDSTCIGCYRYDICKQASADTLQTERSE